MQTDQRIGWLIAPDSWYQERKSNASILNLNANIHKIPMFVRENQIIGYPWRFRQVKISWRALKKPYHLKESQEESSLNRIILQRFHFGLLMPVLKFKGISILASNKSKLFKGEREIFKIFIENSYLKCSNHSPSSTNKAAI